MRLGMFLSLALALMLSVWSTPSLAAVTGSHGTTVVALQQPAGGGAAHKRNRVGRWTSTSTSTTTVVADGMRIQCGLRSAHSR